MKYAKTMMTYLNYNNETYYDFNMVAHILRVHVSQLKRDIKRYGFATGDYIKYKNRHLYSQNAVIDFIVFLVEENVKTGIADNSGAGK